MSENISKKTYVQIENIKYFIDDENVLSSFSFKINKRGGESAKIVFSKDESVVSVNTSVCLYVNGEKTYSGFVEKIASNGKEIYVLPVWGKLKNKYILGTLGLTGEAPVKDVVFSLKSLICETGIFFSDYSVSIPENYKIETSMSGRSVSDILDECEKSLPEGYVWTVDSAGMFFFGMTNKKNEKTIGADIESFSQSETETDYEDVYSECLVKIKDTSSGSENMRTLGIVGKGVFTLNGFSFFYPVLAVHDFVGSKTKVREFNIEVDMKNYDSLKSVFDMAYNEILYQSLPVKAKVKNINTSVYIPKILEDVTLKNMQNDGISIDILGGENSVESSVVLNSSGGQICPVCSPVGYSLVAKEQYGAINLKYNKKWIEFCNHTHNITNIIIAYNSENNVVVFSVKDDVRHKEVKAHGGYANIDISDMEKRNITIKMITRDNMFVYKKLSAYADYGAKTQTLTTRLIEFSYSAGTLTVNAEYSKVNAKSANFLFNQSVRIKEIEKLLSKAE